MKSFVLFGVLIIAALASCDQILYPRGCIYVNGKCQRECEEGTHAYTTGCGHLTPEATCEHPNPETDTRGQICDYSACYCNPPTVRDTKANKCVALESCAKDNPIPL